MNFLPLPERELIAALKWKTYADIERSQAVIVLNPHTGTSGPDSL